MDYLECKALSEVVEAYEGLFLQMAGMKSGMAAAGLDSAPLRRELAPTLRGLIRSYRREKRRYESACNLYLASLPETWSGPPSLSRTHYRAVRASMSIN